MLTLQAGARPEVRHRRPARARRCCRPARVELGGANVRRRPAVVDRHRGRARRRRWRSGSAGRAPASAIQAAAENERAASFARLSPQTPRHGHVGAGHGVRGVHHDHGRPGDRRAHAGQPDAARRAGPGRRPDRPAELAVGRRSSARSALGVVQSELQFLSQHQVVVAGVGQAGPAPTRCRSSSSSSRCSCSAARSRSRGEDTRSGLPAGDPAAQPAAGRSPSSSSSACALIAFTAGSYRFGIITSLASALIALSLVVLTGMVGQISLAQAAFAGVAGLIAVQVRHRRAVPALDAARRARSPRSPASSSACRRCASAAPSSPSSRWPRR